MSGTETNVAERWLIAQIRAVQPDLRIYNEAAAEVDLTIPIETGDLAYYPCAVIRLLNAVDEIGVGGIITMTELRYLVEVIDRNGSLAALESVWETIHPSMHQQRGTVAGGEVYYCLRIQPFKRKERTTTEVEYTRLGGMYRLGVRCEGA